MVHLLYYSHSIKFENNKTHNGEITHVSGLHWILVSTQQGVSITLLIFIAMFQMPDQTLTILA